VTTERRALDALLARYPDFDLLAVDWQTGPDGNELHRVWLLVELGQRAADGSDAWARHRFAVWRRTGAVHGLSLDGAVTDDPLFVATRA
jgi:hypothetical protein